MPRDYERDLRDRALEDLQDDGIPAKDDMVKEKMDELRRADERRKEREADLHRTRR